MILERIQKTEKELVECVKNSGFKIYTTHKNYDREEGKN